MAALHPLTAALEDKKPAHSVSLFKVDESTSHHRKRDFHFGPDRSC